MELNYDCIRDVLLAIEKVTTFDKSFTLYNNLENLQQYTIEELQYHFRQCDLAGFLYDYQPFMDGDISVLDLSFQGHEFLHSIRTDKVWFKTKDICKELGIKTLNGIIQISSQIISQIISDKLGIR